MRKKILSCVLATTIIAGTMFNGGIPVRAAESGIMLISENSGIMPISQEASREDALELVIKTIKLKLNIGDEYSNFNYYCYENGSDTEYSFSWSTSDSSSYIYAATDGAGNIKYADISAYKEESSTLPEHTKDELRNQAIETIRRVGGDYIADHITYVSATSNSYYGTYNYSFKRCENGIEMPDNSVSVSISYKDGSFKSYSANWNYGLEISDRAAKLSVKDATKKINKQVDMELVYGIRYDEEGKASAYLYYTPSKTYIAVDAVTGEIYTEKIYWNSDESDKEEAAATDSVTSDAGNVNGIGDITLSDAEIAKLAEVASLISAEEAIKIVSSSDKLYLDKALNSTTASLRSYGDKYVWQISMFDNTPVNWDKNDYYRAHVMANVDAKTGELTYFYASLQEYDSVNDDQFKKIKVKYTEKECKEIFEGFAKEVNPDRFSSTEYNGSTDSYIIGYNSDKDTYLYGGKNYSYVRVNEGARLYSDSIYGNVEAVTGKITRYGYNWNDEIVLPSTKGVITPSKAFEQYVSYDGFGLKYEIVSDYSDSFGSYGYTRSDRARLVYVTEITSPRVDAFTGKHLNYNGEEYVKRNTDFEYTDIKGSKYERAIELLASLGVGFADSKFKPNKIITRKEFSELLSKAINGGYALLNNAGLDTESSKKLTRQYAAYVTVSQLGYTSLLSHSEIFKTGYSDESSISKKMIASVAVAKALNIMGAVEEDNFAPGLHVSRGEAAQIILNSIIAAK